VDLVVVTAAVDMAVVTAAFKIAGVLFVVVVVVVVVGVVLVVVVDLVVGVVVLVVGVKWTDIYGYQSRSLRFYLLSVALACQSVLEMLKPKQSGLISMNISKVYSVKICPKSE
jgi:hypothetical protein